LNLGIRGNKKELFETFYSKGRSNTRECTIGERIRNEDVPTKDLQPTGLGKKKKCREPAARGTRPRKKNDASLIRKPHPVVVR